MLFELLKEKMDPTFSAVNATKVNFELMVENLLYYNDFKEVNYDIDIHDNIARVNFIDYGINMVMKVEKDECGMFSYEITDVTEIVR